MFLIIIMVCFDNSFDIFPPDCCYDHRSGCAKNDCSRHQDCKTGLCVPDPECAGGCICDPGEGKGQPRPPSL